MGEARVYGGTCTTMARSPLNKLFDDDWLLCSFRYCAIRWYADDGVDGDILHRRIFIY